MTKEYVLKTADNEKINITTFGEENKESKNCIIFVHGFKGFKDWGFGPYLAEYFSNAGYYVITFNFSLNGVGENSTEFTESDKFAQNTYSREVDELSLIIDSFGKGYFGDFNKKSKLFLLGHSRGGAVSILTGSKNDNVNAVAAWSAVANLDRYTERQKKVWKEKGYFEVENSRTGQIMKMNLSFLKDLEGNIDGKLNMQDAVENMNKPLFLAHGDQDLAVPVKEAEILYEWSDKTKTELFIVHNTGHTFNVKHPFEGSNDKFEKVLSETVKFFNQN